MTRFAVLILVFVFAGCGSGEPVDADPPEPESSAYELSPEDEVSESVVPDVLEMDGADAESEIDSAGLAAVYDESDPSGCEVEEQYPSADEYLEAGGDVELILDCRQRDWSNEEGDDWSAYEDAFDSAAEEGCQALFNQTADGSLYDDDYEYTADDCYSVPSPYASDDAPSEVPDDPEQEGGRSGFDAGCAELFLHLGSISIYWGNDSFYEHDCTALNPY